MPRAIARNSHGHLPKLPRPMQIQLRAPRHTDGILQQLALGAVASKIAPEQRAAHHFAVNGREVAQEAVAQAVDVYERKLERRNRPDVCARPGRKGALTKVYCTVKSRIGEVVELVKKVSGRVTTWFQGTKVGKVVIRLSKRALELADKVPLLERARKLVIEDKSLVQGKVQVDVQGPALNASKLLLVTDPSLTSAVHWGTMVALGIGFIPRTAVLAPIVAVTDGVVHRIAKTALLPFVPISPSILATGLGAALAGLGALGVRIASGGRTPLSLALAGTGAKLGAMTFLSIWPVVGDAARAACVASTFKRPNYELVSEIDEPKESPRVVSERLATRDQVRQAAPQQRAM